VEVDGAYHSQRVVADARRTRVLERLGYRVLRLEAEVVSRQLPFAVAAIRNALRDTTRVSLTLHVTSAR
jgi:very-short-patch-repair endonuclease